MLEDPCCDISDVVELHLRQVDPGFHLVAVDHRIAQLALVPEVPVDRPFVDSGELCDSPDRQSLPIPDG